MPLTGSDIQYTFKVLGKAIKLGLVGAQSAIDYQSFSSVTNRQISPSGINTEYDEMKYIGAPVQQIADNVSQIGQSLAGQMKSQVSAYFQNSLALDLGLSVGVSANAVAAALVAQMISTSQTVAPSGSSGLNANGYAMYFWNNYGVSLPQSATPTIPDTWITSVMVP